MRGSEATELGEGVVSPPPTVGRFFSFGGQNHVNLVHACSNEIFNIIFN